MKTLLKFAFFCLFFLSFSQVGFGQADTVKLSQYFLEGFEYGYVDSTYFENITFLESKITSNKKISKIKNNVTGEVLTLEEIIAQFPGGNTKLFPYIYKNMKYPSQALSSGQSGKVLVEIKITESGLVENHRVKKGVTKSLDKEALRIIKLMPAFSPAKLNGQPVSVIYTIPIVFKFVGLERAR